MNFTNLSLLILAAIEPNARTFEEALSETGFGFFNFFLIAVAGCIFGTVLFETFGMSFVLPVTDCDLHFTNQQKGALSAIGFIGIIASSHLWGFLADTQGRRRIIRPTLQLAFVSTFISSFLNNFWALLVFRFFSGFFVSGGSATIYAYLGEFHSDKIRSKAIMGASVVFGCSTTLIPVFAWIVINQPFQFYIPFIGITFKSWRLFIIVCGLPGLFCSFCLYIIPESPKYVLMQKGNEEALIILRKIFAMNTRKDENEYPVEKIISSDEYRVVRTEDLSTNPFWNVLKSMWRQTSPLFHRRFIRQTLLGCLLQFTACFTANGLHMWFPDILDQIGSFRISNPTNGSTVCQIVERNKIIQTQDITSGSTDNTPGCRETLDITAYHFAIILEVLYTIGFALIGLIINFFGKESILLFVSCSTGAGCIALIYVTNPLINMGLLTFVLLSGLSIAVVNAAMVDLFPTSLRAMAVCITLMVGRTGSVAGANIAGALFDYNCQGVFIFCGVQLIAGGFLGFLLPKKMESEIDDTVGKTNRIENGVKIKSIS